VRNLQILLCPSQIEHKPSGRKIFELTRERQPHQNRETVYLPIIESEAGYFGGQKRHHFCRFMTFKLSFYNQRLWLERLSEVAPWDVTYWRPNVTSLDAQSVCKIPKEQYPGSCITC
jgi:hypothetical protein